MSQETKNNWKNPEPDVIKKILLDTKTIAIVGLSSKPERDSNAVACYLIERGFNIIPVNPVEDNILGLKSYPDLKSIGQKVDMVDIFRKSEATPPIVEEAISIGARYIWLQEGVTSQESHNLAEKAGIPIVMDRCIFKEHKSAGI